MCRRLLMLLVGVPVVVGVVGFSAGESVVGTASSDRGPAPGNAPAAVGTVSRPNVLVYLTDDQPAARATLAVMPTVRRLFERGGRTYPKAYVTTPLCGPSRATIMSGRYAHNHRVTCNGPQELVMSLDQAATIQRYLSGAGYRTALVGKYLNRWPLEVDPPTFDRWSVLLTGRYTNPLVNRDGVVTRVSGYSTDILAGEAVRYLREFEADGDLRPWLMFVDLAAPHSPYTPAPRDVDAAVPGWSPDPASTETDVSDKPPLVRSQPSDLAAARVTRRQQLRSLMAVDDLVERVDAEMVRLGEQNTMSVFMSDNGYLWNQHHLRDTKRFPYEPSVRVPMLLRWPGHVPGGSVDRRLVSNLDLLPTFLEATGTSPALKHPLDGSSLLGNHVRDRIHLEYWKSTIEEGTPLEQAVPTWASTHGRDWQYTEWYDDAGAITFREYYDLAADPYQLTNLLADGVSGNEPELGPLHTQLVTDHHCEGRACP